MQNDIYNFVCYSNLYSRLFAQLCEPTPLHRKTRRFSFRLWGKLDLGGGGII